MVIVQTRYYPRAVGFKEHSMLAKSHWVQRVLSFS